MLNSLGLSPGIPSLPTRSRAEPLYFEKQFHRSFQLSKYVVRHGVMRNLGVFGVKGDDRYGRGAQVIARTSRGLETGEVL